MLSSAVTTLFEEAPGAARDKPERQGVGRSDCNPPAAAALTWIFGTQVRGELRICALWAGRADSG